LHFHCSEPKKTIQLLCQAECIDLASVDFTF